MVWAKRASASIAALVLLCIPAISQNSTPPSADKIWHELAAGNRRFVTGKMAQPNLMEQRNSLTKSQHPLVAVLSCSDSRVPPELVFDAGLGELFVVRSAGEDDGPLELGSLEYAVEHLGSSVLVVMGHQGCGAVTAACSQGKPESVNLDAVLRPILSSCKKVDPKVPLTLDSAIRDHVHQVAKEVLTGSEVLRKASEEHRLTIIEAYYSLDSGEVTRIR